MKKKLISVVLSIVLALGLTACSAGGKSVEETNTTSETGKEAAGSSSETDSSDAENVDFGVNDVAYKAAEKIKNKEKIKVGFIVQDLTINYFLSVIDGIENFQGDFNMEVAVFDGKSDAANQVTGIENLLSQGVDAIVICPVDPVAPEAAIKEAQKQGVPVISWSELVKGSDAFLTLNQHEYGYTIGSIAGQWIKENFENPADAKVMYVTVPEVEALAERGQGLKDGVAEFAPNVTVVSEQAGNTPEAGMKAVETTLSKNPDLNVIVCTNDSVALGAYEAMAAAGKEGDDICIVGGDADSEALKRVAEGGMYRGTVDLGAYEQGEKFCELVQKVLTEGPQKEAIYIDFIPVTEENISKYVK